MESPIKIKDIFAKPQLHTGIATADSNLQVKNSPLRARSKKLKQTTAAIQIKEIQSKIKKSK